MASKSSCDCGAGGCSTVSITVTLEMSVDDDVSVTASRVTSLAFSGLRCSSVVVRDRRPFDRRRLFSLGLGVLAASGVEAGAAATGVVGVEGGASFVLHQYVNYSRHHISKIMNIYVMIWNQSSA